LYKDFLMVTPKSGKKRGLGRGLEALLGGSNSMDQTTANSQSLSLDQLQAGRYQPRQVFTEEAIAELAESIKAQGLIQPIAVRPLKGTDMYEIIAGERRFRASRLAGLTEIPVYVHDVDDKAALAMALVENLQREDLNALEEARGIARLIEEFKLTHEQASEVLGRSRSAITNLLRLLQCSALVQKALAQGVLEAGHARAMLSLPESAQRSLLKTIELEALSVREVEQRVKLLGFQTSEAVSADGSHKPRGRSLTRLSSDWLSMQNRVAESLGLPVVLLSKRKGAELRLSFASIDELNGFLDRLQIATEKDHFE
jgi:ParB family transcriptional regulator, chromosome partitioning protein